MKKNHFKIFLILFVIAVLPAGCNLPTDSGNEPLPATEIEILYPLPTDTIGVGVTEINYTISTPASLKFMELYINGNFSGNFPPPGDGTQPKITLNLDPGFIGSKINYYLIYYDVAGTSQKSKDVLGVPVVASVEAPSAPFNLKIITLSQSSVNLSWSDSSIDVSGFEVWRKINFDGQYQNFTTVGGNVFNINDEGLDSTNAYFYKIRAVNNHGVSGFSEEVNSKGLGSSGNLYPPDNLIAVARGMKIVALSWNDNSSNENFFTVERRTAFTGYNTIVHLEKNSTSYVDKSEELFAGGEFYYRIKAFSGSDSAWSNEAFVKTQLYDIIHPEDLKGIYLGDGKIVLDWKDNDATNTIFEIERKNPGTDNFVNIAVIPGDRTSYLDENLMLSENYSYRIRSGDGVYFSLYSNEITIFTGN